MKLWGAICAVFALLVWGCTFSSTRTLLADFSPLEIMVVRFAIAWVVLWGVEGVMGKRRPRRFCNKECCNSITSDEDVASPKSSFCGKLLFPAMGLTGVFLYQFLENCAIYYTNATNVAILVSFAPIVAAVFAWFFTRDRSLSLRIVVGSLVAIAGVAFVSYDGVVGFGMRPIGDLMAIGAMASWGVYSVLLDKANERGIPARVAVRKAFGWTLVCLLPLAVWGTTACGGAALDGAFRVALEASENAARFLRPMNLANLVFLGVMASALSFIAWSKACAALGVVRTTICLYFEPIIGVAFAALFLGERPTPLCIVGGVLIVFGVAVANKEKRTE